MEEDCGFMIMRIDRILMRHLEESLEDFDLTPSQIRFVMYMARCGDRPVSMKEIEERFDVAQPTVAGIMKKLERRGFVELAQSPSDRRAKNARLTDAGRELVRSQEHHRILMENRLMDSLEPDERERLRDMLSRILDDLSPE